MTKTILTSVLLLLCTAICFKSSAQDQATTDDKILSEYFAKNHIKATKTPTGLYYVITKKGTGDNAKKGQNVSMKYYGKLLDGQKFDANVDDNFNVIRPFSFTLGIGQVIRGWDEGVQLLNPGTKATLYLPSGLAYGARGAGGRIPPNAILVFDVELVSAN